ncbi:Polysaccharide deacetylase [Rubripirellula tenax]|uniref:Polysaccharide deacetylase n=1 Tax=Rubripirellula tenax TaxID=2528015 RepID=A0A5C6FI83_9BACT|nr:polysaccharide deacetylase family protein [Rubripirellula tenax]TWU60610.1 Polysaccharide deacetylase [Rubripirellula tenax]
MTKKALQNIVRSVHHRFFSRPLPQKLGIYFHEIESDAFAAVSEMTRAFRDLGYHFTGDPAEFMASDRPLVFLSIDDNFRTTYELLDLADELDIRFAVYLNTLYFRGRDSDDDRSKYLRHLQTQFAGELLSEDEVREIDRRGHTIGAHTHSHRRLTDLDVNEAQREITECRSKLADVLGATPHHFSYPFGMRRHFSESLRSFCAQSGFQTVANAIPGMQHAAPQALAIQRSGWDLRETVDRNFVNLRIDGRWYERITGRSAVV